MPHGVYWGNYITNGFADSIIFTFFKKIISINQTDDIKAPFSPFTVYKIENKGFSLALQTIVRHISDIHITKFL